VYFAPQVTVENGENERTGTTPLMSAAQHRAIDVVRILKQHQADVNKVNNSSFWDISPYMRDRD